MTPAELTAITVGVGALGGIGGWFLKTKVGNNKPSGGNGLSVSANLAAATTSLVAAVNGIASQLNDVRDGTIRIEGRLAAMPTTAEVQNLAEKNRHDYRSQMQGLMADLDGLMSKLEAIHRDILSPRRT